MRKRIGLLAALLVLGMTLPAAAATPVSGKAPVKLSKHDRVLLADAEARVELINMSIGIIEPLNDGNSAWPLLYDRLIDRYGVQMFIAAGNLGPGLNTVNDPSTASRVMSVGGYFRRDTWLSDLGAVVNKEEGVYPWSSRGPREDGGFKPDIVASGAAVSAIPLWETGYVFPGTYALPPGYVIAPGTSVASPQATGGAALLLSAAKQSGLKLRPDHLRAAIRSSARFLNEYDAHEQGMGLMDVPAAWAILVVDDPATTVIGHQMMLTVVAAEQFSADNNFSAQTMGAVGREAQKSFFFHVPAQTPGFSVSMNLMGGEARMWTQHPSGLPVGLAHYTSGPADVSSVTGQPESGVWEVNVETFESSAGQADFKLAAAVVGIDMTPGAWKVDGAQVGQTYSQTFHMTNRFGSFTGRAAGTALGSAIESRPTIDTSGHQLYYVQVEPGSTLMEARIGNAADQEADLDLVLHDCSSGECIMRDFSVNSFAEEAVSFPNPNAGLWIVQVIPFGMPAGSTAYDYLEVFTNPLFGSVRVADTDALRSQGASWPAEAGVRADAAPAPGRFLRGFVEVRSGSSVLNAVEVRLENITP